MMSWGVAVGSSMLIVAAPVIVKIVYGQAFGPASGALQWMVGVCAMAAINGHYRFGLIAAGQQTAEMWTALLGAVTAVALIPAGYAAAGVTGAAAGLCIAEIAVWFSAWWFSHRHLALPGHVKLLIRPLLACAFVWVCLQFLPVTSKNGLVQASVLGTWLICLAWIIDPALRERLLGIAANVFGKQSPGGELPEVSR